MQNYHHLRLNSLEEVRDSLREVNEPSARTLYSIWERRQPVVTRARGNPVLSPGDPISQVEWLQSDFSLLLRFIEQAFEKEEFLLVCDAYHEGLAYWQGKPNIDLEALADLHCHYASARVRLGSTGEASRLLQELAENVQLSKAKRAIIYLDLGDIQRELSHFCPAPADRMIRAREALRLYEESCALDPNLVEAHLLRACMLLIVSGEGSAERARAKFLGELALESIDALDRDLAITDKRMIQHTWYRAVVLTVMGNLEAASAQYEKLQHLPGITTSQLTEARFRSQFLAEAWNLPRDAFYTSFPPLELIVFCGHVQDYPYVKGTLRIPQEKVPEILAQLEEKLESMRARVGLTSAAAGGDLLFIEALQRRGAQYHISLPWSIDEFVKTSVEPYDADLDKPFWKPLFDKAIAGAASVRELGQFYQPGDSVGWEYCREVTAGLALLTARISRLDIRPFALMDERVGSGTESFVKFWSHYLGQQTVILSSQAATPSIQILPAGRSERDSLRQEVKSMLFADIVGYSKLTEKVIRDFVEVFMQRLSELMAKSSHAPRSINTWGDAVFAVFDFAEDAGRFSLQLMQVVREGESEWLKRGLCFEERDEDGEMVQRPLNIRIGLHTGPVFAHYNPILRQLGYTGQHVNRAARIEPIASPGEIYASEEFAAMAELGNQIRKQQIYSRNLEGNGFICEFTGSMPLAKNYPGRFRLYRLEAYRELGLEELAEAAHELYVERQATLGKTVKDNPILRPWSEITNDIRNANRAQVGDIPNRLFVMGFELTPGPGLDPSEAKPSQELLEKLAIREHERWMTERASQGWVYGKVRDNARRYHPDMLPWEGLSEPVKQLDRDVILNMPALITKAGFRLRKITSAIK